jgi:hypothetical protein
VCHGKSYFFNLLLEVNPKKRHFIEDLQGWFFGYQHVGPIVSGGNCKLSYCISDLGKISPTLASRVKKTQYVLRQKGWKVADILTWL